MKGHCITSRSHFLINNFSQEFIIVYRNKDYFYHVLCLAFIQPSSSCMQILTLEIFIYTYMHADMVLVVQP